MIMVMMVAMVYCVCDSVSEQVCGYVHRCVHMYHFVSMCK